MVHFKKAYSPILAAAALLDIRVRNINLPWYVIQEGYNVLKNKFGSEKEEQGLKIVRDFRESVGIFGQGPFRTEHLNEKEILYLNPANCWKEAKRGLYFTVYSLICCYTSHSYLPSIQSIMK